MIAARYQPGDELGKGAFSRVYCALDVQTGGLVAIKQVDKYSLSEKDLSRIRLELELMRRLDHPNIVCMHNFDETAEHFHFILEYIEGGSLHSLKAKYGSLPESLTANFVMQTLRGLHYLHGLNIVHRDVKVLPLSLLALAL